MKTAKQIAAILRKTHDANKRHTLYLQLLATLHHGDNVLPYLK